MKRTFDKSNVYHSTLVKAGPTTVKLKGPPLRSKYPKEGASHVAYFVADDDTTEYTLIIEDAALGSMTDMPVDEWITVEAVGSRESADVLWAAPDHQPADNQPSAPGESRQASTSDLGLHVLIDKLVRQCMETVDEVAPDASPDARLDCATRLAASVFIEQNRRS